MKLRSEQTKPVCVILDTNVWLKNPLLKDPLGAALLFSIRQLDGCIGMPEVIEREIIKNVVKVGTKAVEEIHKSYKKVLIVTGVADDYRVPSEADFEASGKARLEELEPLLKRIPFSLKHAKSALQRVNDERPPNSLKNQQFKDSAIWEAVLELAASYTVHFVTEDKGFFENRETDKGLAATLKKDCEAIDGNVFVYADLSALLSSLKDKVLPLDSDGLTAMISAEIDEELHEFASTKEYSVGAEQTHSISAFLTEKSHILAISFEIKYEAFDLSQQNTSSSSDYVMAKGNCSYDLDKKQISDTRFGTIEYHRANGEIVGTKSRTIIFGVGGLSLGRKQKTYKFKEPVA